MFLISRVVIFLEGDELIIVSREEDILRIIFNSPPLNILTIPMMEKINSALEKALEDDSLRAVIFDHQGKVFSAGVDVADHVGEKAQRMLRVFHDIFKNIHRLECPVIASVRGAALGGGAEIALFCDFVIASTKAKFGQPEIKVGVFPPVAAYILPRLTGYKKALELLLLGETIDAAEAHRLGLVNHVFPIETYDDEFAEFIGKLKQLSTVVLRHAKRAIQMGLTFDFENKIDLLEQFYLEELMRTHDANEGLQAFLEKRPPKWENR